MVPPATQRAQGRRLSPIWAFIGFVVIIGIVGSVIVAIAPFIVLVVLCIVGVNVVEWAGEVHASKEPATTDSRSRPR